MRDYSLPGISNRPGGELVRPSSLPDPRGQYVPHVRGSGLLSAYLMNRQEGNLQYEGW
jgi:hypothetical protein